MSEKRPFKRDKRTSKQGKMLPKTFVLANTIQDASRNLNLENISMHFQPWKRELMKLVDKIDATGNVMTNLPLPTYGLALPQGAIIDARVYIPVAPPPVHDYNNVAWQLLTNAVKNCQMNQHRLEFNAWQAISQENERITLKRKVIKKQWAEAKDLIYNRLDDDLKDKIDRLEMSTPHALMTKLSALYQEFSMRHVGLLDHALDQIKYVPKIGGVDEVRRLIQLYADKMQDNGEALTMGMIKRKFYAIFSTREVEDLRIFNMPPIIALRKNPIGTLQNMVDLMLDDESELID
jgi:hypothetical protein